MKILSVAMTLIFLFSAADYCCAGGIVKSVENIEIVLAGGVFSNSVNLTKNQAIANCVPFVTQNMATNSSDCNLDDWFIDVYLQTGPKVTIQRTGNSGAVTAGISVVEFAPDAVKVQSGVFNIASNLTNTTITLAQSADTNKAALVHYSRVWKPKDDACCFVQARYKADNQVLFERQKKALDLADGIRGHYYVFEALGSKFSVQVRNFIVPAVITQTNIAINAVNTNKTFIISSYKTSGDDSGRTFYRVSLASASAITVSRKNSVGAIANFTTYIIEFSAGGAEGVQRGEWNPHTGGTVTATLPKAVNTGFAMPWNPSLPPGMIEGESLQGEGAGGRQKLKLTGSTSIESSKYPVGINEKAFWEVIEWEEWYPEGPVFIID